MDGKTQNTNESFNGRIWERIPKNTFVTLPSLEFGVYDTASHFNIGMKASVLIYEKPNFVPAVDILKGCITSEGARKTKLRRQILQARKMFKNDKALEKEGHLYVPGGF